MLVGCISSLMVVGADPPFLLQGILGRGAWQKQHQGRLLQSDFVQYPAFSNQDLLCFEGLQLLNSAAAKHITTILFHRRHASLSHAKAL